MSLGSSPASAMAARQASSVSSSGSRPRRRATSDWATPLMTHRFSMYLSLMAIEASVRGLAGSRSRPEQRDPHVAPGILAVVEHHLDGQSDVNIVGVALDDVGLEAHVVLLVDGDERDHVRQRHFGQPRLMVDREGGD